MMIVYWTLAALVLFVATSNALVFFEDHRTELGASTFFAPFVWIMGWSYALVEWRKRKADGLLRLAGVIVIVTTSLLGAGLGGLLTFLGLMSLSYGAPEERVAADHYMIFGFAGTSAFIIGLLLAGIVVGFLYFARKLQTPHGE